MLGRAEEGRSCKSPFLTTRKLHSNPNLFLAEPPLFSHGFSPLDRGGLFPSHGCILDPLSLPQTPTTTAAKSFSSEGSLFKPTPINASPRSAGGGAPAAAGNALHRPFGASSTSSKPRHEPMGGLLLQTVTTTSSSSSSSTSVFRHISGGGGESGKNTTTAAASAAFGSAAAARQFSPLSLVTGPTDPRAGRHHILIRFTVHLRKLHFDRNRK